jgi:hypothetical protein
MTKSIKIMGQMMTMTKIIRTIFAVDVGVIVFTLLENNTLWLVNTQIAFVGSLAVTLGSYLGYRQMVARKAQEAHGALDEEDQLSQWDDTHRLYEEGVEVATTQGGDEANQVDDHTQEKRPSFLTMLKTTSSGVLSLFRIVGYLVLIGGFFGLVNRQMFDPISYFVGLAIVPIAVLVTLVITKYFLQDEES